MPDTAIEVVASRGTVRHRDHVSDHDPDHEIPAGPRQRLLAAALLEAVAEGRSESMMLARELAEEILGEDRVQRAAMLRRLVADGSPFALVRAVELAELLLGDAAGSRTKASQ